MSTGLLNQLETYYADIEATHHDVTPDRVLGHLNRVREVPAPTPMPVRTRPRVWIALGAAAIVLLLVALIPTLVGTATQDSPPATEPTTVPEDVSTTVADAASAEAEPVDLEALLDTAIVASGRYWQRPGPESEWSPPGVEVQNTADLWFMYGSSDQYFKEDLETVFGLEGRTDALTALLLPSPETRLEAPVTIWLNEFADDASAAAFVDEFVDPSVWEGMAPLAGRGGSIPAHAEPFTMPPVGDEAFGFFGVVDDSGSPQGDAFKFVAMAGARSGPVVVIVSNPIRDAGNDAVIRLTSEQDVADEAIYLAASVVAAHHGTSTPVQPPRTTPLTDEEAAAIATVVEYHEALTQADYDTILRLHRHTFYTPNFVTHMRYRFDPLFDAGAVFEVSYCRPTSIIKYHRDGDDPDGDPSGRYLEIKCVAGYRSPDGDSFEYRGWEYEDGKLRDPAYHYGRDWDIED